ncbi:MAG: hypothetical protein C0501_11520 [Isosphaera sp.]|nr:hypothetical protein [Isosphaera sp.]
MNVRALFPLAAAAGFWLAGSAHAQQPPPNPNQALADAVKTRLQAAGLGDGADIRIDTEAGVVTLTGSARDYGQKGKILREVQGVTGVVQIRDGVRWMPVVEVEKDAVTPAQFAPTPAPVPPMPLPPAGGPPAGHGDGPIVEPAPLGVPGQYSPDMQAPNLPGYAWPTYAPYNNVSRVAYPTAYPYNAFPFIGPYYPFPKVPLGWRKVTLEWTDGHWYLGRNSAPHDYWRVKFW